MTNTQQNDGMATPIYQALIEETKATGVDIQAVRNRPKWSADAFLKPDAKPDAQKAKPKQSTRKKGPNGK